ncbi:MAG: flagellin B [Sulfuricurvum sp.]|uniref:flagellin B n=2 Tax=Sulfuricurvum sp. TaxID=2025608 RepID=UPI002621FAE4|nr:flagellin B [Sulfuricurvum sp.]MDD2783602.1 flagellin B [Sulfuricurvum sp.]
MGFRINTNIAALNAHTSASMNNRNLDSSLSKLSSGLRINSAADDASGMAIADSLRSQSSALGQAISNANDGISIIQTADKAMDEQLKILDTIKTKATQAAQDGQTTDSRKALQADITRLMEELDNIAGTTSFNGQQLLSGQFTNKEFQIGAYSNQSVKASIGATSSDKIGQTRFETGGTIVAGVSAATLTFSAVDGKNDITLESVTISTSAGTGLGVLAEVINKSSDKTGVHASYTVQATGVSAIASGTISGLTINGVTIGLVDVKANDKNGALVAAINAVKDTTGVVASVDSRGRLVLNSADGRGIKVSGTGVDAIAGLSAAAVENYGRLSLTRLDGKDIRGISTAGVGMSSGLAEKTVNLRDIRGAISADIASAMGFNANSNAENITADKTAGVTTLKGAMAVMSIAETAQKMLDRVRSDLGSVQNQLVSTVNNISVTQVNVKAAESNIRDVDFAAESANFSKYNILAQSGSYAMSQANAVQQNVLKLLQ